MRLTVARLPISGQLRRVTVITYSEMITFYPRIETISDDPPKNHDGRIRGRYGVFLDNLAERLEQGESSCWYRVWSVSGAEDSRSHWGRTSREHRNMCRSTENRGK